ncbi:rhodanese-like domain-containing protein [Bacillus shivajii]|uniref:rhodanese-like domain-containing protein n=1 Tax=Bacillus shivajii TaxID=1983719 RepID=UPI001CFA1D4B|nr:rhodanese-like domain-containing protein [Bacillus shivajii]UCZ53554.1 rhodanese-like domain-containing protein [Bacillus shivajii]
MDLIIYALMAALFIFLVKQMMPAKGVGQITTDDLKKKIESKQGAYFVDVREKHEFKSGHIREMKNIPLSELGSKINTFPKDKEIVLICRSGNRSMLAAKKLKKAGYSNLINVRGGMSSWAGPIKK